MLQIINDKYHARKNAVNKCVYPKYKEKCIGCIKEKILWRCTVTKSTLLAAEMAGKLLGEKTDESINVFSK